MGSDPSIRQSKDFYEDVVEKKEPMRKHMDNSFYYVRHLRHEWGMIAASIGNGEAHRILDIGCGPAHLLSVLDPKARHEYVGIDIARNALPRSTSDGPVHFLLGNAESLPFSGNTFDVIVVSHLIEHLHHVAQFLTECSRLLRHDGRLIIATPNAASPLKNPVLKKAAFITGASAAFYTSLGAPRAYIAKVLDFATARRQGRETTRAHSQEEHVHEFTPKELQEELERRGFRIKEVRYSGIHVFLYSLVLSDLFGRLWYIVSSKVEDWQSRGLRRIAYDFTITATKKHWPDCFSLRSAEK